MFLVSSGIIWISFWSFSLCKSASGFEFGLSSSAQILLVLFFHFFLVRYVPRCDLGFFLNFLWISLSFQWFLVLHNRFLCHLSQEVKGVHLHCFLNFHFINFIPWCQPLDLRLTTHWPSILLWNMVWASSMQQQKGLSEDEKLNFEIASAVSLNKKFIERQRISVGYLFAAL